MPSDKEVDNINRGADWWNQLTEEEKDIIVLEMAELARSANPVEVNIAKLAQVGLGMIADIGEKKAAGVVKRPPRTCTRN